MSNAEKIVQKQLDYYNAGDLEKFLSTYHEDIEILKLEDNSVTMQGKEELKVRYGKLFENKNVHAKLANRIVIGDKVIDHEHVTGMKEGEIVKAVAVYKVEDNLIKRVWFLHE